MLIDTHCHIHDSTFEQDGSQAYTDAIRGGVKTMVCIGTDMSSSQEATRFAQDREGVYFTIAMHPHEAAGADQRTLEKQFSELAAFAREQANNSRFVAIGECGLDYYYHKNKDIRSRQAWLLQAHLELAAELAKPVVFHVRDAYDDFWPIYDEHQQKGVLHSFSDTPEVVEQALQRQDLFFGLNGIMTFTKNEDQLRSAKLIPLKKLVLETDAPYLTPKPLRGRINTPANVKLVATFLSDLREEPEGLLVDQTTSNARNLFGF